MNFNGEYNDEEVKNYFYVNGTQNNYTINMGEHSSLKIFGDGKPILDFSDQNFSSADCSVLESKEAKEAFGKLRKSKILDKNNMPKDLSLAQRGVLVSLLADRLDIPNPWEVFGYYWNMNKETLRTASYNGYKQQKMNSFIGLVNDVLR